MGGHRGISLNGEIRGQRWTIRAVFNQSNPRKVTGFQALGQNIFERKHPRELPRESEKTYRLLFEDMMNGVALHEIILDKKGRPADYTFLEVNDGFETITGLKRNDVIGRKAGEVLTDTKDDFEYKTKVYGEVSMTGGKVYSRQFSRPLHKWFSELAFSPQKGRFATVLYYEEPVDSEIPF